ncbi:U-box domain-containing protein 33-like isoform X1 [Rhododendron vialii]|uniref:U-box domain-containing protein 33-like isoform X1 n=2 Tax=Rhododendron vialii TaxID=182163 RepID=UPI00265F6BA3|nr:U-box domain-containing protein 33-like isoform X1 [Rhododendron vialii]
MADDSASVETDSGSESRELQVYWGNSPQHSSPSTSLQEGGGDGPNYELYDELEEAMAEEDKSLREAFEKSMRRREDLKDAINDARMRERKDFEEELARKAQKVENMSQQVDKLTVHLCIALDEKLSLQMEIAKSNQMVQESEQNMLSAVEQLDKYKMERDDLQEHASNTITPLSFSLHEIEGATGNFDPSMKIGQGGYGSVYRGFLRHTQVAIKTLTSQSMQGRSEFQHEVHNLSKLRHPNIVTLIGSCPDACIIIYEYLPNGSLEDRLSCRDNSTPLSWKTRIRIAAELCSVLIFLHSESIVHGDLKPDNILLDANYVCKLSDFGMCRVVNRNEESSNTTGCYVTVPKGTFGYIDPDFAETGELTPKSDVYSFAVILLRLLTGNKPAVGLAAEMQMALDGGRLKDILDPTVEDWPFVQAQQLAYLALRCCKRNRTSRPDLASEVWWLLEPMRASCDISSFQVSSDENRRTPPYFICPILQDIMVDPHVAADGYTYELEAVRGWLDGGHSTSPMTNLQLPHCNIVPNHSLRSAIQEWQQLQRR